MTLELWLVVGGCGWWRLNNGWLWVVVDGGGESWVVAAKLWLVVDGRGYSQDLVMSIKIKK